MIMQGNTLKYKYLNVENGQVEAPQIGMFGITVEEYWECGKGGECSGVKYHEIAVCNSMREPLKKGINAGMPDHILLLLIGATELAEPHFSINKETI